MTRARQYCRAAAICWLLLWISSSPLAAQDDRGFVQRFLEESLSTVEQQVELTGVSGSLFGAATIDRLTIRDDQGIWLDLREVVLDWNRAALLRGEISVKELSASSLIVLRRPLSPEDNAPYRLPSLPAPTAQGFSLPDLPVAIEIGRLTVESIALAAPVLGQPLRARTSGTMQLADGQGQVSLLLARQDDIDGQIDLEAGFSNDTRRLTLDLAVQEGSDGLIAHLLGLPDRPAVQFVAKGAGTPNAFQMDVALSTDGVARMTGQGRTSETDNGIGFEASLAGDLRPLIAPEGRAFLGRQQGATLRGLQRADGSVQVDSFALTTERARIEGALRLDPTGWPRFVSVEGETLGRGPFVLPVGTRLERAELRAFHDSSVGPEWSVGGTVLGLQADAFATQSARITARGTLTRTEQETVSDLMGRVVFDIAGLAVTDPGLQAALGPRVSGHANLTHSVGGPVDIDAFQLGSDGLSLAGSGQIGPTIGWDLSAITPDMTRFEALFGRPVRGGASVASQGSWVPATGVLDLDVAGTATDLAVGQSDIDPLLAGDTNFAARLARDASGTRLQEARLHGAHLELLVDADLREDASTARVQMTVAPTGIEAWATLGPLSAQLDARQDQSVWALTADVQVPSAGRLTSTASVVIDQDQLAEITARSSVTLPDLTSVSKLAGQDLSGLFEARLESQFDARSDTLELVGDWTTLGLGVGDVTLDALLSGQGAGVVDMTVGGATRIQLRNLTAQFPHLSFEALGQLGGSRPRVTVSGRLDDLGRLARDLSGPAQLTGQISQRDDQTFEAEAELRGAAGLRLDLQGTAPQDFVRLSAALQGTAPLALLNGFTAPTLLGGQAEIDVTLDGPPELGSLSGQVALSDVDVALPDAPGNLTGGAARLDLRGAQTSLRGQIGWSQGGRIDLAGRVTLDPGAQHGVDIELVDLTLALPGVVTARADGTLGLNGNLSMGTTLAGRIDLTSVEVSLTESGSASANTLVEVAHVGDTPRVQETRARAGIERSGTGTSTRVAVPLDIEVSAPARVFVRGRGLDAELGGAVQLSGTLANPAPSGGFSLLRGRMDLLGTRLTLSEVAAQFEGNLDPEITVAAGFSTRDSDAEVRLSGQVSEPTLSLSSTPELPEDEILAQLLFGRPITQISALQAVQMAAAIRTLTGGGGAGFVDRLRRQIGIDDLDIATQDDGTVDVTVGAYLSENLYSDVEFGSDGTTEINLNLDIGAGVTARGSSSNDGRTGIGLFFERDY